ncbi:hypothetical protein SLE2022_399260 [Rubroshorea leprosula]
MTMLEKLFVQIFERKKRIIDQVKDQIILFDHHLASKCLIEGFDPPSWLLSSSKSGNLTFSPKISALHFSLFFPLFEIFDYFMVLFIIISEICLVAYRLYFLSH